MVHKLNERPLYGETQSAIHSPISAGRKRTFGGPRCSKLLEQTTDQNMTISTPDLPPVTKRVRCRRTNSTTTKVGNSDDLRITCRIHESEPLEHQHENINDDESDDDTVSLHSEKFIVYQPTSGDLRRLKQRREASLALDRCADDDDVDSDDNENENEENDDDENETQSSGHNTDGAVSLEQLRSTVAKLFEKRPQIVLEALRIVRQSKR